MSQPNTPHELAIGIAGAGRIAQALGRLLRERGEPVVAVASRRPERAEAAAAFIGGVEAAPYSRLPQLASRLLIAVSDDAIAEVAAVLAGSGASRGAALHTSGAHGPEALAPLQTAGVSCATLHPLQTVATPGQGLTALPGAAFAICGDEPAARWAERIAALLGGQVLRIPADRRPLYHAAAVLASNCIIGLIDAAVILMGAAGVAEDEALRALAPLVRTSAGNALTIGPLRALTGPVQRGDLATVSAHLLALAQAPPSVRNLYRAAGLHLLELARRRGLPEAEARRVQELLNRREEHRT